MKLTMSEVSTDPQSLPCSWCSDESLAEAKTIDLVNVSNLIFWRDVLRLIKPGMR